jgi:hypothetical protein
VLAPAPDHFFNNTGAFFKFRAGGVAKSVFLCSREWYPRELRCKIRASSSKCWCAAPAGAVLVCVGSKKFEQCVAHIRTLYSRTMPFVFVIPNAALSFIVEQFTFMFCIKSRLVRPIGILSNLQVSFDHSSLYRHSLQHYYCYYYYYYYYYYLKNYSTLEALESIDRSIK